MLPSDLLLRRETHFTFWRPNLDDTPPVLVIGTFAAGNPNSLANQKQIPLSKVVSGRSGFMDALCRAEWARRRYLSLLVSGWKYKSGRSCCGAHSLY